MAEAKAAAHAALTAEQHRRREVEAEVRALRQRVQQAEAAARRAERFVEVARDVLHPAALDGITKLAKRAPPKALVVAANPGHDDGPREPPASDPGAPLASLESSGEVEQERFSR